ncbi:MAG TPA: hypothetical protein VFO25_06555 [Candidatus Eremiobacteraceae bacterium]|nr:hypothetical protein [Candidatus Eremiobacteraceae bacterium]
MKRQIIKTKPVRPYRVARIIIAAFVIAIVAALAFELWTRAHAAHALAAHAVLLLQDSPTAVSNPPSPAVL